MSLFLNCASAVIDITAKVAYLLFSVRGSTLYGFWRFTWFLASAQGTNSATGLRAAIRPQILTKASDADGVMDLNRASGCNIDHRNLPDLQGQRRPEDGLLIEKLLH